jgi:hypothetical protein
MLQVIRRLSKVLAYGCVVYLSLDIYNHIGAITIYGDLVTTPVWATITIGFLLTAWIATKVVDWVFADRES